MRFTSLVTSIIPEGDFDGDGFSNKKENELGQEALVRDEVEDGGITSRRSKTVLYFEQQNSAPVDLELNNSITFTYQPIGTFVGKFTPTDPNDSNGLGAYSYLFGAGAGGEDNNYYQLNGNLLYTASTFTTEGTHFIRIKYKNTEVLFQGCTLRLKRGKNYEFVASGISSGHTFMIGGSYGDTSSPLVTGEALNSYQNGAKLILSIPENFSGNLYYFCTYHTHMIQEIQVGGSELDGAVIYIDSEDPVKETLIFENGTLSSIFEDDYGQTIHHLDGISYQFDQINNDQFSITMDSGEYYLFHENNGSGRLFDYSNNGELDESGTWNFTYSMHRWKLYDDFSWSSLNPGKWEIGYWEGAQAPDVVDGKARLHGSGYGVGSVQPASFNQFVGHLPLDGTNQSFLVLKDSSAIGVNAGISLGSTFSGIYLGIFEALDEGTSFANASIELNSWKQSGPSFQFSNSVWISGLEPIEQTLAEQSATLNQNYNISIVETDNTYELYLDHELIEECPKRGELLFFYFGGYHDEALPWDSYIENVRVIRGDSGVQAPQSIAGNNMYLTHNASNGEYSNEIENFYFGENILWSLNNDNGEWDDERYSWEKTSQSTANLNIFWNDYEKAELDVIFSDPTTATFTYISYEINGSGDVEIDGTGYGTIALVEESYEPPFGHYFVENFLPDQTSSNNFFRKPGDEFFGLSISQQKGLYSLMGTFTGDPDEDNSNQKHLEIAASTVLKFDEPWIVGGSPFFNVPHQTNLSVDYGWSKVRIERTGDDGELHVGLQFRPSHTSGFQVSSSLYYEPKVGSGYESTWDSSYISTSNEPSLRIVNNPSLSTLSFEVWGGGDWVSIFSLNTAVGTYLMANSTERQIPGWNPLAGKNAYPMMMFELPASYDSDDSMSVLSLEANQVGFSSYYVSSGLDSPLPEELKVKLS